LAVFSAQLALDHFNSSSGTGSVAEEFPLISDKFGPSLRSGIPAEMKRQRISLQ